MIGKLVKVEGNTGIYKVISINYGKIFKFTKYAKCILTYNEDLSLVTMHKIIKVKSSSCIVLENIYLK